MTDSIQRSGRYPIQLPPETDVGQLIMSYLACKFRYSSVYSHDGLIRRSGRYRIQLPLEPEVGWSS